jgi:hypothetical protein
MERDVLKRIAGKLRRAGASIPAPQVTGTIEGSVVSGLCVALAIVEGEIEALAQPADNPYGYDWSMLEAAQESLREHMARIKELEAQLAHPAQESVGMLHIERLDKWLDASLKERKQREWVGLTENTVLNMMPNTIPTKYDGPLMEFAKAVEKALQEKNT